MFKTEFLQKLSKKIIEIGWIVPAEKRRIRIVVQAWKVWPDMKVQIELEDLNDWMRK